MPAGLQIWDASGNLRLDTSVRMATVLGSIWTGTSNGSLAVPELATRGSPFAYVTTSADHTGNNLIPTVRWSGTTLIWEFLGGNAYSTNFAVTITYGFF